MSFLNGFLDNVVSGALSPKGNLADYAHGARLFVDDSHRLTPKVKFLYHVTFNINAQAAAVIPQLREKHLNELNMLVKSAQLPAYNIQTDVKHQYNRKRVIQKRIDYQPVSITLHDDNMGVTTAMWEAYYRYYYRDGNYAATKPAGAPESGSALPEYNRGNIFSGMAGKQYRYGFDNDSTAPFFDSITISQMARKNYTSFQLINPIISGWQHDTMDNSVSDPVQSTMTIDYETVHYSRGPIGNGGPKGFAEEHYDKTPSPNSLAGGGASSLLGIGGVLAGGYGVLSDITGGTANFGTVLKAANTLQNAGGLNAAGVKGELLGSVVSSIGKTAGIDVSGVAGVITPNGGGGGSFKTIAAAAAIVGGGSLLSNALASGATKSSTTTVAANSATGPRDPGNPNNIGL
jgi:hypothetical protein|tara:strand:- start:1855 stop:3066 length:1212 start_codon:yes stop_codon:yes gene_type:complete